MPNIYCLHSVSSLAAKLYLIVLCIVDGSHDISNNNNAVAAVYKSNIGMEKSQGHTLVFCQKGYNCLCIRLGHSLIGSSRYTGIC